MVFHRTRAIIPAALLCLAVLASAGWSAGMPVRRRTVCTISFNGSEEVDVFRASLPPDEFEFVDLAPGGAPRGTPAVGPASSADLGRTWLVDACRPDVQCDVVIYTGEFAGQFFGTRPYSLGLQAMEEASCQARCDGLFHQAQEVFLLACNTLATKDEDRRTPAEYLQVLLDHGFDRPSAESVVETRYGPLGPSFRETLRRTFAGVPRVYGFTSVAPRSEYTVPMLARYLHDTRDYARHLDDADGRSEPNGELLRAFHTTALAQAVGVAPSDPGSSDRAAICALYDDGASVLDRLRIARAVMSRDDFLTFVPTLEVFLQRHPPEKLDAASRVVLADIRGFAAARERVLALVRDLDVSALKLELADFSFQMGWMTADDVRRVAVDGARLLLARPLTSDVTDVMCEITAHVGLGDGFRLEDLRPGVFAGAEGVRLVDCLHPADERVNAPLIAALDAEDPSLRVWAAYALSRRLPLDAPTLTRLASYLDDPLLDVRERVRWSFRAQGVLPGTVLAAVRARDPELARELRPDTSHGHSGERLAFAR
ncbi:MAG TPA: hypothetical protein VKU61_15670 [Candidatus Binatia bacterium]|nr:hypothetical protein [Candidatus Binatia bacterium]